MPHSQPTALQQTVCKFHLDPQYHISHWGSTILGDSTLCIQNITILTRWNAFHQFNFHVVFSFYISPRAPVPAFKSFLHLKHLFRIVRAHIFYALFGNNKMLHLKFAICWQQQPYKFGKLPGSLLNIILFSCGNGTRFADLIRSEAKWVSKSCVFD